MGINAEDGNLDDGKMEKGGGGGGSGAGLPTKFLSLPLPWAQDNELHDAHSQQVVYQTNRCKDALGEGGTVCPSCGFTIRGPDERCIEKLKAVLDGVERGALHAGDVVSPHELEVSKSWSKGTLS